MTGAANGRRTMKRGDNAYGDGTEFVCSALSNFGSEVPRPVIVTEIGRSSRAEARRSRRPSTNSASNPRAATAYGCTAKRALPAPRPPTLYGPGLSQVPPARAGVVRGRARRLAALPDARRDGGRRAEGRHGTGACGDREGRGFMSTPAAAGSVYFLLFQCIVERETPASFTSTRSMRYCRRKGSFCSGCSTC
jgi:hypothetical protein